MQQGERRNTTHVLKILKEVGDSFPLAVCEDRIVESIAVPSYSKR